MNYVLVPLELVDVNKITFGKAKFTLFYSIFTLISSKLVLGRWFYILLLPLPIKTSNFISPRNVKR